MDKEPIPKGSTVFCPGCGTGLYKVVQRIFPATIRFEENFEPLTEYQVSKYPFECPECKRLIISSGGKFMYTPPARNPL